MQLFVYGSLMQGGRHHDQLRGAKLLEACRTTGEYALLERGPYPVLVRGSTSVPGELFEVSEPLLVALDEFEGKGYERTQIRLLPSTDDSLGRLDDSSERTRLAWAYVGRAVEAVQSPRGR